MATEGGYEKFVETVEGIEREDALELTADEASKLLQFVFYFLTRSGKNSEGIKALINKLKAISNEEEYSGPDTERLPELADEADHINDESDI